jgi:selenide, water dikinase
LNKTAGQLATEFDLRGGTDVTGFSLLGHGTEVAKASGVGLHIEYSKIPFLSGARDYAENGIFPGGAFDNRKHFEGNVRFDEKLSEPAQMLLFDPQTSGGLLLGIPREKLKDFQSRANELDQAIWVIGEARAGKGIEVRE